MLKIHILIYTSGTRIPRHPAQGLASAVEPGNPEVLASFEMDEVELAEQSAKLDALATKWKRRRLAMEDEKAIQART